MSIRKRLKAGVTIEVVMAIALSVVVLFLVLGLFSDNIQTMATRGKLAQMNAHNNDNKTVYEDQTGDPTQTQINVQMVGDQGTLAWYHSQAQAIIEGIGSQPPPLSDKALVDLARALTVFAESVPAAHSVTNGWQNEALGGTKLAGTGISYAQLASNNHIYFMWGYSNRYQTTAQLSTGSKNYDWKNGNDYVASDPTTGEPDRISNVTFINGAFN